jgi:L-lactate dehydrogenase
LLLVDVNSVKRDGQVQDLSDAASCAGISTHIRSASLKEAGQCDIIIIALGCRHRSGIVPR